MLKHARKVAVLIALVALTGVTATSIAGWQTYAMTWKFVRGSTTLDSSLATVIGSNQSIDTSSVLDARSISEGPWKYFADDYKHHATLHLWTASTPLNTDTVFIAVDRSFGPTGPWVAGTLTAVLPEAANKPLIKFDFLASADSVRGVPYLRFRLRGDGNTAALYPGARITISRW